MRCAIYARKSTDDTDVSPDHRSVARQIDHARAFAARHGWTVEDAHIYADDGISGAEFERRPAFLRLMNALKPRRTFDVLVMSEESRLGREAIETAYALKQLLSAGVRVWSYLAGKERVFESPTDKLLMSVSAFADELEREKARQRTYDAMARKAAAGHVTGGRLFGYTNVAVTAPDGRRLHVIRQVHEPEAAVVRRIFDLSAQGYGMRAIAKILNDAGSLSPRAQRGRSQSWAPSSVREVLFRTTYKGVVTWNQSRKRDAWGRQQQRERPQAEWMTVEAPDLRIITDEQWQCAHARLATSRAIYLQRTTGRPFGRPPSGASSKYLLTGLCVCGLCGSTMKVISRHHGRARGYFLACAGYHDRGRSVCTNGAVASMPAADTAVIGAVLEHVVSEDIIDEAIDLALERLSPREPAVGTTVAERIRAVEEEIARLSEAIAVGGELAGLLAALKTRQEALERLQQERRRERGRRTAPSLAQIQADLRASAADWRAVLVDHPLHSRPLLASLLTERVTLTPQPAGAWHLRGIATITGLFERVLGGGFPLAMASPTGFEPVFQP